MQKQTYSNELRAEVKTDLILRERLELSKQYKTVYQCLIISTDIAWGCGLHINPVKERHTHSHAHSSHSGPRKCGRVLGARLVFVFQQNRQCLNLLCLHQCHYPDSYSRLDYVCVWERVCVYVDVVEGKRFYHVTMSWILHTAWCVLLCWQTGWSFEDLDVWRVRLCLSMCVWVNTNSFQIDCHCLFSNRCTDAQTAKEQRLKRNLN